MVHKRNARRAGFVACALILAAVAASPVAAQPITICHTTGSPTVPWVFLTIDDSTWAEHQAHGDIRASSLAECRASAATAGTVPQAALGPPLQQQPAPTVTPQPTPSPVATSTPVRTLTATPLPTSQREVAPTVDVLPPSGEPTSEDPPWLAGLVLLSLVGAALRRIGRARV